MAIVKTQTFRAGGYHAKCSGKAGRRAYLEGESRALEIVTVNIDNPKRWDREMDRTRDLFSLRGNVTYREYIISCNEKDRASVEQMKGLATRWVEHNFPTCEAAIVLHNDNRERLSQGKEGIVHAHVVVNSVDLGEQRKVQISNEKVRELNNSAQRIARELGLSVDREYEVGKWERRADAVRSETQPERWGAEGRITQQGRYSYKANTRDLCLEAARRATGMEAFRKRLDEWGVSTEVKNGRVYVTDRDEDKYTFRADRLHPSLAMPQLQKAFERNAEAAQGKGLAADIARDQQAAIRHAEEKEAYLQKVADTSERYSQTAQAAKGTDYEEFPQIKLPRPTDAMLKDPDMQGVVLSALRKGDRLRDRLAANVPVKQNIEDASLSRQHGQGQHGQTRQESHRRTEQDRAQDKGRPRGR